MVNDWKSDLRERLDGLSVEEPEGLKEAVMESLGQKKRRRTVFVWLAPAMAAAAAIALVFLPGRPSSPVMRNDGDSPVIDVLTETSGSQEDARLAVDAGIAPKVTISTLKPSARKAVDKQDAQNEIMPVTKAESETTALKTDASELKEEDPAALKEAVPEHNTVETTGTQGGPMTVTASGTARDTKADSRQEEERIIQENIHFRDAEKPARRFHAQAGLLALAPSIKSTTANGYGIDRGLATKGMIGTGSSLYGGSGTSECGSLPLSMILMAANAPTESTVRHRMPVNVGAMVSIGIAPRLYVETGVLYTSLHSEFSSGNRNGNYVSTQNMSYIGVPLGLRYNILETDRLDIYASASGVMRKPVGYSKVTVSYIDGKAVSTVDESDADYDYLQWSAVASAGVQYNIARWVGIYAEPGFAWHFQNKSPVVNIYSDRQADFNLAFGVRFSFN